MANPKKDFKDVAPEGEKTEVAVAVKTPEVEQESPTAFLDKIREEIGIS